MVKELRKITVKTLPNGYSLSIGTENYMYTDEKGLLEGVMFHLGLGEKSYIDKETMAEFLTASIVWRADDGNTTKKMMKTMKENESLRSMCDAMRKRIKALESGVDKRKGRSEMKRLLKDDDCE